MRTDQKLFCLKTLLTIFLSLLWLVGAGIFGVLLWLRLDFWTNEYLELDSDLERYLILIYITLAAGGVILLFSILGLLGGCCKNKWLLAVFLVLLKYRQTGAMYIKKLRRYLVAILSAMGLTISAVVYGIIYREELEDTLMRERLLEDVIVSKYSEDNTNRYTRVVDIMQSELECCGSNGPTDYSNSRWKNEGNHEGLAPASCCRAYQREEKRSQLCRVYKLDTPDTLTDDIWKQGCRKPLNDFLENYVIVVIIIAGVYFLLQLVCMIITSVLIHVLRSLYVPQPDDIVYDMAHNQEKSPYPSRGDYRDYYH